MIWRALAGTAACFALLVAAYAVVDKTGLALTDADAMVTVVIGLLIAVSALILPKAWAHEWRVFSFLLVAFMICAEGFNAIRTSERIIASRDAMQAPLRVAQQARDSAMQRLQSARAKLTAFPPMSARMIAADKARRDADAAVAGSAAKPGCARNCRLLLAQQVSETASEVQSAREAHASTRSELETELQKARSALAALPVLRSATPLADRMQWPPWAVDFLIAVLGAGALNGLAALLLVYAGHGHAPQRVTQASPAIDQPVDIVDARPDPDQESALQLAKRFSLEQLKPTDGERAPMRDVIEAFQDWCQSRDIKGHSSREIVAAFRELFDLLEIQTAQEGGKVFAVNIELHSQRLIETA